MTQERKSGLARLLLRWPERRGELLRADTLADLYEGYSLACEAAHWWGKQPGAMAAIIADDYRNLVTALELEVSETLDAEPHPSGGMRQGLGAAPHQEAPSEIGD
ncbi:hypothetical protein BOSEA31B_10945 [Hyphomicrobiales bacterium]|nr:hypothetical protein BOSEA31B_10945 [Hyphomicrobiales bacterium]CAH1700796.1 hypothetical protein BOSEA1005_20495 [Hyphomicrobiales bacterium]CAI0344671.1 hypothetical protein BO1005MUT1_350038 [Hyphomicrobiales bacterium]